MALDTAAMGKTYAPSVYAVGREKIREYAYAVGESNPLHLDPEAAREAGYADVVAPPMFAVVYSGRRWPRRSSTPRWASTSPTWSTAVRSSAGARSSWPAMRSPPPRASRTSRERGGMGFYVFETVSVNQRDETVCTGTWTNIVRSS